MVLRLTIASLVSLVMACSRFEAAPDATGSDGAVPVPVPDAGPLTDGATAEAAPPLDALTCDMFNREAAVDGTLWESSSGVPMGPYIVAEVLVSSVQSSAIVPNVLTSRPRMRGDTIQIRAKVTLMEGAFGGFGGRLRVLVLDASADDPAEYAAVSFDNQWHVEYREYPSGMLKLVDGPPVVISNSAQVIELTARFHPTAGFVHATIDGTVVNMDGIGTEGTPRSTWRAAVGLESLGETPLARAAFDDVCISREP